MRVTLKQIRDRLGAIGYRDVPGLTFRYTNKLNPGPAVPTVAFFVVEDDTGLHFPNIAARRDANYHAFQAMREEAYGWVLAGRTVQLS